MKPFLALLRVNFKQLLLTTFNMGRGKRKAPAGIGAFALLCFIMIFLSGNFSYMLAAGLAPLGGLDIMLMAMLLMVMVFPLMLNLFTAQSLVFSVKDIDLVMSMPISPFKIMLSRVMALYLEVLVMTEMLLLPVGVVWLMFGGEGGALFMVLLLVLGLFLALLPTMLSLIFGAVVSLLTARLRFKNLFTILFSFLLIVGIMVVSFAFTGLAGTTAIDLDGLRQSLVGSFPPVGWMATALAGPNPVLFLGLLVLCLAPFLLVTWVFSLFYKPLLTKLSSTALKKNFKLRGVAATGRFRALLGKESRKFFGTPAFVLNVGFSVVLVVGVSVFALFQRGNIAAFLSAAISAGAGAVLMGILPYVMLGFIGLFIAFTSTASVSISLEGKTLWILKAAPVGTSRIFAAKVGFDFLLNGVMTVLSVPLLAIAFSLSPLDAVLCLVVCLLFALLTGCTGLFANLLLPRMDVENDSIIIKQSTSMLIAMLINVVLAGLVVGLAVLMYMAGIGFVWFSLAATVLLLALNAGIVALLATKGRRLFAAL